MLLVIIPTPPDYSPYPTKALSLMCPFHREHNSGRAGALEVPPCQIKAEMRSGEHRALTLRTRCWTRQGCDIPYFSNNQGEKRLNFSIPTKKGNPKSLKFN